MNLEIHKEAPKPAPKATPKAAAPAPKPKAAKTRTGSNKGIYTPKFPEKYKGNPNLIRFMSGWELRFMQFLDLNPNVLFWASEEVKIPYFHPLKKKMTIYIPDFVIQYKDQTGKVFTEMIEIKPKKEAVLSKKSSLYDRIAIGVNQAKWASATSYCDRHGVKFRVLTEQELFKK